jgi:autotransporter-associated beta strand protein
VTFNNQMYLGNDVFITSAGTANVTYSGNITNDGTASVTKIGTGTLTLSGVNTWRGSLIAGAGTTILSGGIWDTNAVLISNAATLNLTAGETIGSLAGAGTMALGTNALTTGGNDASTVFSGVIEGSAGGDLFKAGTGTFTLAGVNTYSGDTVVNAGTLAFSNGSVNNSIIRLGPDNSAGDATVLLSDSDGGTTVNSTFVVRPGGGTRSLVSSNSSGTNTYAGSIYLDGNATVSQQAAGVFALTGGVIDVKSQTLTLSSVTNGNVAVSATIFDSDALVGNLVKSGNGTVTLTGANAYAGTTLISGGTLQVGDGGATGQLGAGNVTNNASLVVNRTGEITTGNTVSGTGSLTKLGSGTLTLSASNSFQGGSTLSAGVIRATHANALGSGALAASAGTVLQVTNSINISNNLSVYSVQFLNGGNTLSGTITNNNTVYDVNAGQTNTLSGYLTGTGSVTLIGGGVLNITGTTNNYTGNTVISNGTVRISTLANSNTVSSIGVNNNVTLAGANATNTIIDYTGGNVTTDRTFVFNGVATNGEGGTLNISNAATVVTMTGSASGTGKMIVDGGTLVLSNTGTADSFAPTSIQVESGATLALGADNQIGNGTGLILNGGTFRTGTGSSRFTDTLGTLTLSADSTIDLGAWNGLPGPTLDILTFANSSAITWNAGAILTITNWQGTAFTSSQVSQILFGSGGLTSTQLGQIRFANQGNLQGGFVGNELVPVPEPRVYAAAIALLATVGWRERKRLLGLIRRKRS